MYSVTILSHLGKPIVKLPEVPPLVANYWYEIARQNGYSCKLEHVGGAEQPNHRVANAQDMQQYAEYAA